jgi:hypothetical protein
MAGRRHLVAENQRLRRALEALATARQADRVAWQAQRVALLAELEERTRERCAEFGALVESSVADALYGSELLPGEHQPAPPKPMVQ